MCIRDRLQFAGAPDQFLVLRFVFFHSRITMLEHQPFLMAEVPDRAIDQLIQYRCKVFLGFPFHYGVVEDIENVHQLAVILIDLVDADAQYLAPNNICLLYTSRCV